MSGAAFGRGLSRQAGDFGSNLVASSKILVAMATKMVLTWRVAQELRRHFDDT